MLDALHVLGLRSAVTLETLLDAARSLEGVTDVTEKDVDRASLLLEKLNEVAAQGVPHSPHLLSTEFRTCSTTCVTHVNAHMLAI